MLGVKYLEEQDARYVDRVDAMTLEELLEEIEELNVLMFDMLYDTVSAEIFGEALNDQLFVLRHLKEKLGVNN